MHFCFTKEMILLCLILSITYTTSNIHKRGAIRKRDHQTGVLLLYEWPEI
jgi:hypothetical protein